MSWQAVSLKFGISISEEGRLTGFLGGICCFCKPKYFPFSVSLCDHYHVSFTRLREPPLLLWKKNFEVAAFMPLSSRFLVLFDVTWQQDLDLGSVFTTFHTVLACLLELLYICHSSPASVTLHCLWSVKVPLCCFLHSYNCSLKEISSIL